MTEFIDDELEARGWSLDGLAFQMGGDSGRNKLAVELLYLRDPDMEIGDELAFMLGRAFGTSGALWLRLDETWRRFNAPERETEITTVE